MGNGDLLNHLPVNQVNAANHSAKVAEIKSEYYVIFPECGHIGSGFQIQLTNGVKTTSEVAFPWYAAIFKRNEAGNYSFICGGSLIENSAVITAGKFGLIINFLVAF